MLSVVLKQLRTGRAYVRARSHPRERILPCLKSALASKKTTPRPSSALANCPGNNSPRISQEATPTTVLPPPCTAACPEANSAKASELGLDLDNITQRTSPTPPRRLPVAGWLQDHVKSALRHMRWISTCFFHHAYYCVNNYDSGSVSIRQARVRVRAPDPGLALFKVKDANTWIIHPPPSSSQQQVQRPYR
jgi:hypothetical protein